MRGGSKSDVFRFQGNAGFANAIAGVTSTNNVFVTQMVDGLQVQWGATAQTLVGGVLLVGKTAADIETTDFFFG